MFGFGKVNSNEFEDLNERINFLESEMVRTHDISTKAIKKLTERLEALEKEVLIEAHSYSFGRPFSITAFLYSTPDKYKLKEVVAKLLEHLHLNLSKSDAKESETVLIQKVTKEAKIKKNKK